LPKIKLAKRSELVYFKTIQYRSEANRLDSDFALEKAKKANFRFFKSERQKTKVFDNELSKFCLSYTRPLFRVGHNRGINKQWKPKGLRQY